MKRFVVIFFLLISVFSFTSLSYASSSYVLPYPSVMPGGLNYKLHIIWEKIMQYWYFGNFGQFDYNLKESDKYLVEAKTLFEYNQYLLGYNALQKSNTYFSSIMPHLLNAKADGENITDKKVLLQSASQKHIEVLQKMKSETPSQFVWSPEKAAASTLQIHQVIDASIMLRQKDL